eukprot:354010-Chlamydomonas_euryale.AAC.9
MPWLLRRCSHTCQCLGPSGVPLTHVSHLGPPGVPQKAIAGGLHDGAVWRRPRRQQPGGGAAPPDEAAARLCWPAIPPPVSVRGSLDSSMAWLSVHAWRCGQTCGTEACLAGPGGLEMAGGGQGVPTCIAPWNEHALATYQYF